MAFSGIVAFNKTSQSNSAPRRKSGCVTSSEMLKLLLPASLPRLPPTASIVSAICSAVRVFVPFTSTFDMRRVMPFVSGVSANNPPRKTATIETSGSRASSLTRSRRPLESSNFTTFPAVRAADSVALAASAPLGLSETTVRLPSTR